jgi:hypothetical protein
VEKPINKKSHYIPAYLAGRPLFQRGILVMFPLFGKEGLGEIFI